MLSQLKANLGKRVSLELLNGSKLFGTIVETDDNILRIDTEEGIACVLVDSVQIIWEEQESLAESDIQEILKHAKNTLHPR